MIMKTLSILIKLDWSLTLQIDMVNEVIENLETIGDIYETAIQEL